MFILRMCFSGIILLILVFLQLSSGKQIACEHSACGNIRNISFPFRLADDPRHCGDINYQLLCEDNTTFLYYYSYYYKNTHKYRVESINYKNYTIRLSDPSMSTNNTCLFPHYSQNEFNYQTARTNILYAYSDRSFDSETLLAQPATFLSCPYPVNQSSYVTADLCVDRNSTGMHKYVKLGHLNISEVRYRCRIDLIVMTSFPFVGEHNNISLLQLHSSLLYGFEVSWFSGTCGLTCAGGSYCRWDGKAPICHLRVYWWLTALIAHVPTPILYVIMYVGPNLMGYIIVITAIKIVIGWPFFLGLVIYKLRRQHLLMFEAIETFLQNHNNLMPIRYSYSNIKKMTSGFGEKLGQGGYGSVYKGKLRSGYHIAVKVLNNKSKSNGQDFMNEVATIGRIHHVNVVRLVGYCSERSKHALLYDFMPNGSLDKYIIRQEGAEALNWEKKVEIAVGIARGIEYLHRGCDIQILHFDIKPHNILLDENFTPKISDFGLAKVYSTEHNTVTLTAARGTIGYVAPELINRSIGNVSYKVDVYSFGMLLMELVGLNRNMVENSDGSSQYFPCWIYDHLDQGKDIENGLDDLDEEITRKMAIVALWCIQMNPGDRPTMSRVVEMLEGEVGSLQIPQLPSYTQQEMVARTWDTDTHDSISLLL